MKNANIEETIRKYSAGDLTLEDANARLKDAGAPIHLDPQRNVLTEEQMRATTVGYYPDQANGWGLLDSGTGTMDPCRIVNGKLADCDMGESYALVYIAGKRYRVRGNELVKADG